jgi:L,D-transpeptidase ErfK/SrfK
MWMKRRSLALRLILLLVLLGLAEPGIASNASAPPEDVQGPTLPLPDVIGERGTAIIVAGDTLLDVADRSHVGFEAIVRLNPGVDVWMPEVGTRITLPALMIPPRAPRRGLVLNLPEMRLYDYTLGSEPRVYPIAIGGPETPSPVGLLRVQWKTIEPTWRVPASIRAVDPELPYEVPPGPNNPLGRHWLGIGGGYGIHGTNNRWSIGRLATHGCIRLANDDIAELYARIPVGTPVRIVYQTVKLGQSHGNLVVEVHPDIYARDTTIAERVERELEELNMTERIDGGALETALREARGLPVPIDTLATGASPVR